jgi:diguanylate cyclase (GGDEF)-like protein
MNIILVEPSRTITKVICKMLEAADHTVRPFADAREALEYLKSDLTVDALITTGEPSSMSGPQLCAEVRTLVNCKRPIYILLMSSNSDNKKLIRALDLGADEIIHKPPDKDELCARLRAAERSVSQKRELIKQADTDVLTGLRNRRSFIETAEIIMARTALFSAIMFDIDRFKRINDDFGHDAGDQVLRMVAAVAKSTELPVGRLGGDEFSVLLEGKDVVAAVELAGSLQVRISNLPLKTDHGSISVTCSFGVSERLPRDTIDDLLKRADVALYMAKMNGRNRVCSRTDDSSIEKPLSSVIRFRNRILSASVADDAPQQVKQFRAAIMPNGSPKHA